MTHQVEREKLLGQISHGTEQLKTEQKRLKESVNNSHVLEDKIERLVEAVRKSKELGWVLLTALCKFSLLRLCLV